MKRSHWLAFLLAATGVPSLAAATDAYVTANVNLRAGPDIGYPTVDVVPAGDDVNIYGCTDGWNWCDVDYRGERGWVAGSYLATYDDGYGYDQPVMNYGAQIGIPIVSFVIGSYWNTYYSHRPFYRERDRWYRRPMPHRPPPPPPSHPWHRPPGGHDRPNGPGHDRPGHGGRPPEHGRPGSSHNPGPLPPHAPRPPQHPPVAPRPGTPSHSGYQPPRESSHPRPATPPRPANRPAAASRPMPASHPPPVSRPSPAARPAPASHGHPPAQNGGKGKPDPHGKDEHHH